MLIGLLSLLRKTMVIDSLNLNLRQIARFSSNVILDGMSSAKCCLFFFILFKLLIFFIAQHEERPLYHVQMVTSSLQGVVTRYSVLF